MTEEYVARRCKAISVIYAIGVQTYHIPASGMKRSKTNLFLVRTACAAFIAFLYFGVSVLLRDHYSWKQRALLAAFFGIAFQFVQLFSMNNRKVNRTLMVDGDLLEAKTNGRSRKLHMHELKTIREWPRSFWRDGGLLISKRGKFGTFMWGGIFVPQTIPDYESIRNLVHMCGQKRSPQG